MSPVVPALRPALRLALPCNNIRRQPGARAPPLHLYWLESTYTSRVPAGPAG